RCAVPTILPPRPVMTVNFMAASRSVEMGGQVLEADHFEDHGHVDAALVPDLESVENLRMPLPQRIVLGQAASGEVEGHERIFDCVVSFARTLGQRAKNDRTLVGA